MDRSQQVRRFTTAALAGMIGVAALTSDAGAQRKPRVAVAARPAPQPPQMTVPYPGATVTVDPQLYQLWYQQQYGRPYPQQGPLPQHQPPRARGVPPTYYVPVPYPAYPSYPSYGGGVTDANGRPLYIESAPEPTQGGYGLGTPDLSGTPYVVDRSGRMLVNFGSGERTIPSCAAESAERAPDGKPRTIFYQPSSAGIMLREGQRGRVRGTPPADARACYTVDAYGRMALDW